MKLLFVLSLIIYSVCGIAIRPMPTATVAPHLFKRLEGQPTPVPTHIVKRDLEDTLSLYGFLANECSNKQTENHVKVAVEDLNNLWQTVTSTIYCGNNRVKTVTKTVTRQTTTTTKKTITTKKKTIKRPACDKKCWSDYLWHTYGYGISVAQGFTGIVMMLIGLYFIIFGFSFFRTTLAAVGFVFFALMTWIGLVNNEPLYGYPHNEIVYTCVSVGLGLFGAFLFMFLYSIAIYFIGVVAGIFLAIYILSWQVSLVIQIAVARICFIIGMGIVFGVSLFVAESYLVIFSTAFTGAYLFILGLDLFIHTGLINAFLSIFDGNKHHTNAYIIMIPTYVMLAFVAFLTLVSFGWQFYWNILSRKKEFGVEIEEKKIPEKKDEEK